MEYQDIYIFREANQTLNKNCNSLELSGSTHDKTPYCPNASDAAPQERLVYPVRKGTITDDDDDDDDDTSTAVVMGLAAPAPFCQSDFPIPK
ncbi:hypothetical protein AgCh_034418 [Apium graveolens]